MGKFKNIYLDYSGKWLRKVAHHRYHMIEMTDMEDACGSDATYKFHVDLSEIDLDTISQKTFDSAMRSCGWEGMDISNPEMIAEMLHSYGCKAPLGDWPGNNWHKQFREARKFSYELESDPDKHEEMMCRSVNAIGSTAREFMQGDLRSPLLRGISEDRTDAKIIGKMHGYSDELMEKMKGMEVSYKSGRIAYNKIPSDDPLAFMMGFMTGINSGRMEDNREDVASAYVDGYKFAVSVRCGDEPWPDWAK